jgi:integrase
LTKSEAENKAKEVIREWGVNTSEHLARAMNVSPVATFRQRVEWCRQNKKAWTKGKPGPIRTMESQLEKHILPRFGDMPLSDVNETAVQEFAADLARTIFEMRRPYNGTIAKTYKLSRKTILNIVGVVKLVLGRRVWMTWELDLGEPDDSDQRYFTGEELVRIFDAAPEKYRVLFALLAGAGMRISEAAGLHIDDLDLGNCVIYIRRGVFEGRELTPKTKRGKRVIAIDSSLADLLRQHLNGRRAGRVFEACNGSPLSGNNIRNRVLHPLLQRLGIPKAGLMLSGIRA